MQERLRLHDDMHYIFMVCVNDFGRADMRQLDQPYNRCSWCSCWRHFTQARVGRWQRDESRQTGANQSRVRVFQRVERACKHLCEMKWSVSACA